MIKDDDPIQRMMRTLSAALGRTFPTTDTQPTQEEFLEAAKVCAGAADMAHELAKKAKADDA